MSDDLQFDDVATESGPATPFDEHWVAESHDALWAAMSASPSADASPTIPDPIWCRRCGYGRLFGKWRPKSATPRTCSNCHTAYWDIPVGKVQQGPAPLDPMDKGEQKRRRLNSLAERRIKRSMTNLKRMAKRLGYDLVPATTGRGGGNVLPPRIDLNPSTQPMTITNSAPARSTQPVPTRPATVIRSTVPPPPGIAELGKDAIR